MTKASAQQCAPLLILTLLATMCGWQVPEKHKIEHGYKEKQELVEVIARLRGREAVRNNHSA